MRKRSILTVKNSSNKAKYLKFQCQKVESTRNGKLPRLSGRFQTLNLETRRNGFKSGVSQIMRENWQSCGENSWHFMMLPLWFPWVMTAEIPYWWHVTTQILVVTSSVWNFCARFSGVIFRGNHSGSITKCQLFSQVINPQEHSKFVWKNPWSFLWVTQCFQRGFIVILITQDFIYRIH